MPVSRSWKRSATSLRRSRTGSPPIRNRKTSHGCTVLTIISTIFIPLGFLAGIWGMNFDTASPWNLPELGFRYGYPVALGFMAAIAIGLLVLFRRRKWL